MKNNSIAIVKPAWHVLFWLFYLSYKIAFENIRVTASTDNVDTFCVHLIHISNFYFILFLLNRFFLKKKLIFVVLLLLGYFAYIPFLYFYCKVLIQSVGHGLYYSHLSWVDAFIDGTDFYFQFMFYAIGFWFGSLAYQSRNKLLLSQGENLQLKNDKLALENEKIKLEYNYLKAQINPHFLYNTLACFYEEAEKHSESLAEGIVSLSDLMRHTLHDGAGLMHVPLKEEIERLRQYIHLYQMRYRNALKVQLDIQVEQMDDVSIPPFVLITLTENAFKHGIYSNTEYPLVIKLQYRNDQLEFYVHNKVNDAKKKEASTGMGLYNVSERLRLAYGEQHQLSYGEEQKGFFTVRLIIKFVSLAIPAAH